MRNKHNEAYSTNGCISVKGMPIFMYWARLCNNALNDVRNFMISKMPMILCIS